MTQRSQAGATSVAGARGRARARPAGRRGRPRTRSTRAGSLCGMAAGARRRSPPSTRRCGATPIFPKLCAWAATSSPNSGKREAALEFYRRALGFKVDLPTAWSNVGKLMFEDGRYAEALDSFDAALGLRPKDADLWNSRAGALRKLGRLEESAAAAREALRLKPRFAEAALNLGAALLKLDRCDEALAAFEAAERRSAGLRRGAQRPGARPAGARPPRRSARRLRGGRGARQSRSDQRPRLSRSDARRFRARLGGLRSALDRGQVARRGAWRALSEVARSRPGRRARSGDERPRLRRHDPVLPLPAVDGRRRRRADVSVSAAPAPVAVVAHRDPPCRSTAVGRTLRRPDRRQQPAARLRHPARQRAGLGSLSRRRAGAGAEMGGAHRRRRLQDRRRLARQSESRSRHGALGAARRFRAARRNSGGAG